MGNVWRITFFAISFATTACTLDLKVTDLSSSDDAGASLCENLAAVGFSYNCALEAAKVSSVTLSSENTCHFLSLNADLITFQGTPAASDIGSCELSFNYTDSQGQARTASQSIEVDPGPPEVYKFRLSYDHPPQLSLSWEKYKGSDATSYLVKVVSGTTPPDDCSGGDAMEVSASTPAVDLSSLTSHDSYVARVCPVRKGFVSPGEAFAFTTLPPCDYVLSSGDLNSGNISGVSFTAVSDGKDSFLELQNFIIAAYGVSEPIADGAMAICLINGINIVNDNALANQGISIINNNLYVIGRDRNQVSIDCQRTTGTFWDQIAFYINPGVTNFNLVNVSVVGFLRRAIYNWGEVNLIAGSYFATTHSDDDALVEGVLNEPFAHFHDSVVDITSGGTYGIGAGSFGRITSSEILTDNNVAIYDSTGDTLIQDTFISSNSGIFERLISFDVHKVLVRRSVFEANSTFNGSWFCDKCDLKFEAVTMTVSNPGLRAMRLEDSTFEAVNSTFMISGADFGFVMDNSEFKAHNITVTDKADQHIGLSLQNGAFISQLANSKFIREVSGAEEAIAIHVDSTSHIDTDNVRDNQFCQAESSSKDWDVIIGDGTYPSWVSATSQPTSPYDGSTTGPETFPWGDESHSGANPGFNQQRVWGGSCQ